MSSNLKYALEKHKTKLLVGSSVLLFGGIGVGSYLYITNPHLFGKIESEKGVSKLAKHIISGNKNGELSLIDIKSGKEVSKKELPKGKYIYTSNPAYDVFYAYNGKEVYAYSNDKNELKRSLDIPDLEVSNPDAIFAEGRNIAVLSEDRTLLTYQYMDGEKAKIETFEMQNSIEQVNISNGILTYSSDTTLNSFSPESKKSEKTIDLGDQTDVILPYKKKLLIHNNFGKDLNENILVTLKNGNLKIDELKKTGSAETQLLSIDKGDNEFYTTQYVQSNEPYHLLDEWKIIDGKVTKDKDRNVKIPVNKDGVVYNQDTTVASKGYLYTHYKDRIQIFDIRSQKKLKNISVDSDFAAPVLTD